MSTGLNNKAELVAKQLANVANVRNIWENVIINAKEYGANADGTDDTSGLQQAIDYAISVGKSDIWLPPGTYNYTTLTGTDGITFYGDDVALNGTTVLNISSFNAMREKIDEINAIAVESNAIANSKADKGYVDTQLANVNAGLKGTYATLAALQTAFPTGTTGIYLVSAVNRWYFWNGSAWTDGGDISTLTAKSRILIGEIGNGKNLFDKTNVTNGFDLNSSGVPVASAAYSVTGLLPVAPSTSYVAIGTNYNICFYDASAAFIVGSKSANSPNTPLTSPANAAWARISLKTVDTGGFQIEAGTVATPYKPYQFVFDRLAINTKGQIDNSIMYADDADWTNILKNGDLSQAGSPAANWGTPANGSLTIRSGSTPAVLSINSATTYAAINSFFLYTLASKRIAIAYSFTMSGANFTNCNFKVWFRGSGGQIYSPQTIANVKNGSYKGVLILDIPADAVISAFFVQFSEFGGTPAGQNSQASVAIDYFMAIDISGDNHANGYTKEQIQKAIDFRGGYSEGVLLNFLNTRYADEASVANYARTIDSTWKGKNFVSFGDSLTAMEFWQPYVIAKLGFGSHTNCGIGGTAVSVRDNAGASYNADSFFQDTRVNAIPTNADLITIMGGFNDFNQFTTIGGNLPTLDSTTFKGALSLTIEKILALPGMNPTVRLVLIAQPYGYTGAAPSMANVSLKQIVDAIKEVGQFYGLPVIDLYGTSGWNYKNRDTYLQDTVHPNSTTGAKRMASIITGQLRLLEPID